MHSSNFFRGVFLFASLTTFTIASERIVNTRLYQIARMQIGESIQINLNDFFQVYSEDEPKVTLRISLPEVVGERSMFTTPTQEVKNGRIVPEIGADAPTDLLQAYEVKESSSVPKNYDSPYYIFPGDLEWETKEIVFKLLPEAAPLTVANFITYLTDGLYNYTQIHRAESYPYSIIQCGGYKVKKQSTRAWLQTIPSYLPVPLEAGHPHTKGTLALARYPDDPDSGTSQFFINLADNSTVEDNGNSWNSVYASFAEFVSGDLGSLDAVTNALKLDLNYSSFSAYLPTNYGQYYQPPAVTPYWDVSPDNWFYFKSITVSQGSTEGISHTWSFEGNNDAPSFEVFILNNILYITCLSNGTANLKITANKEGFEPISTFIELSAPDANLGQIFPSAILSAGGWYGTWFGWFNLSSFPFINHTDHGYEYIDPASRSDRLFIYDLENYASPEPDALGWYFTNESLYPWIYVYKTSQWYRFLQGSSKYKGARWFYNISGNWITDYKILNP